MKNKTKTKQQFLLETDELQARLDATERRLQEANELLQAEITKRKGAEETFEEAQKYAGSIVETIREPLLVLTADLKVISANQSFYQTFKVTPEETEGRFIYSIGNHQWDIPALRELLEGIVPQKAIEINTMESKPSPTSVEPMVLVQSQRPPVAIFIFAKTMELANSPIRYAMKDAINRRGVNPRTCS